MAEFLQFTLSGVAFGMIYAVVALSLVLIWRGPLSYAIKAAALVVGTLLTTPYLFMYDMVVLAIAVAFLVRQGLSDGFAPYEPVLLAAMMLMLSTFLRLGEPVGLAATLIGVALVLRRAGLTAHVPRLSPGCA